MAFYLCPMRRLDTHLPGRACAMIDFDAQIRDDGGSWDSIEVLGNVALVKVNALPATLTAINAATGFVRLPVDRLNDPLNSLSAAQRNAITNKLQDMGYSLTEIRDALSNNIGTKTLGEVLRFAATRRLKARYDAQNDMIVLDGPIQVCESVDALDARV